MGKKCILFCRVSTSVQDWKRQRDNLRNNAIRDGYAEEDIIPIGHKESGYNLDEDEREGLRELEKYLKSGEVDCVYVWELSRIARKPKILYDIRDEFKKYSVQLKCDKPSFVLLSEDLKDFDTNALVVFSVFTALAEQEIFLKKARFSDGKKKNAEKNRYNGGNVPFGYFVKEDKTFGVNEEEAKVIHDIFDWYEDGYSINPIIRRLKEQYIGGRFRCTHSFVHNLLKSELLTGESHEDKEIVETIKGKERRWHLYPRKYPQIITKEQFDKCRAIAKENNTNADKTRSTYFASGILKCPSCGRYMVGVGARCVYRCYDANNLNRELDGYDESTRCQERRNFSINIIDTILWQCGAVFEVSRMMLDVKTHKEEFQTAITETERKIENIRDAIKGLEKKRDRIQDDYYDGRLTEEKYVQRYNSVQQEINNAEASILAHEHEILRLKKLLDVEIDDVFKSRFQEEYPLVNVDSSMLTAEERKVIEEYKDFAQKRVLFELFSEQWDVFMKEVDSIVDDTKRKEIIKKNIKSIDVSEGEIPHKFGVGERIIKVRYFTVCGYNNITLYFYAISNCGHGAEIYLTDANHSLSDSPIFPVINRFEDKDKKKRRAKRQALKDEGKAIRRKGKYTVKELMALSGWSYGEIHYAIAHKGLKAERDGKELIVSAEDWENYCKNLYVRKK